MKLVVKEVLNGESKFNELNSSSSQQAKQGSEATQKRGNEIGKYGERDENIGKINKRIRINNSIKRF